MHTNLDYELPLDNDEYRINYQSSELQCAIWEYAQWLRQVCNYGDPSLITAERCRDKLFEFLNDRNITLL